MRGFVLLATLAVLADGPMRTERGRSFKGGAQDFRALSPDGLLLLAAGTRTCASQSRPLCSIPVLTVYRTADAKKAAELEGPRDDYFYGGDFTAEGLVTATTLHASLRWDPATSQTDWGPSPARRRNDRTAHGVAVAADGSLSVDVQPEVPPPQAGDPDDPTVHGPAVRMWLHVSGGGESSRRVLLDFPERPTRAGMMRTHWTGARMTAQFAEAIAISPDRRWVAIGYGVRFGDTWGDAQARIAIFSIADGHRAGWIDGARYRRNVVVEALRGGDGGPTLGIPLGARIAFSPDSRTLYGTSLNLFGVDVASLR